MYEVEITSEPVELYKILKFEGLAASGAEAKAAVADGLVLVNGSVETRKRRKIIADDIIEYADEKLHIRLASQDESLQAVPGIVPAHDPISESVPAAAPRLKPKPKKRPALKL